MQFAKVSEFPFHLVDEKIVHIEEVLVNPKNVLDKFFFKHMSNDNP